MELANKTIIITGASSGIGAAAASLFASEGADVVLGARRSTELQIVVEDIKRAGGRATFLAGDVRDAGYAADRRRSGAAVRAALRSSMKPWSRPVAIAPHPRASCQCG